jgi:hypothetical protein
MCFIHLIRRCLVCFPMARCRSPYIFVTSPLGLGWTLIKLESSQVIHSSGLLVLSFTYDATTLSTCVLKYKTWRGTTPISRNCPDMDFIRAWNVNIPYFFNRRIIFPFIDLETPHCKDTGRLSLIKTAQPSFPLLEKDATASPRSSLNLLPPTVRG